MSRVVGQRARFAEWICIDEDGRAVLCLDLHSETVSCNEVEMTPGCSGRAFELIPFYPKDMVSEPSDNKGKCYPHKENIQDAGRQAGLRFLAPAQR